MNETPQPASDPLVAEALARIEQRLRRLEDLAGLAPSPSLEPPKVTAAAVAAPATAPANADGEELEFTVGQNWFALVGVMVLTCGVALALSLPYGGLPAYAPSAAGYVLAAALLLVGRWGRRSFALVAGYFQGAALSLLYYSTVRLCFFGQSPVLDLEGAGGRALLAGVAAAIIAVAWWRESVWLMALGLTAGAVTAVLVGAPGFVFAAETALAAAAVAAAVRRGWPGLVLFAIPAAYVTHLLWALNRPWSGREVQLQHEPAACSYALLLCTTVLAAGPWLRRDRSREDALATSAALLNCGAGYLLLLVQTSGLAAGPFIPVHLAGAVVYLALAVAFWLRERSRAATFFYAMTGYLALSAALLRAFPSPDIFLWLSLQSLVVVSTALWFRSRFIVVANFFIFAGLVASYMFVAKHEQGISLGFGVVALLTARVLRWQQQRLELKTELMRNFYLASAFVVFPYALYQLVPRAYVGVAWVGLAVAYYLMNLVVRSPKYRWMGHCTLLLSLGYVLVIGITQLSPAFRIASFLVLGTVLLLVSLVFTRARARRRREQART